MAEDVRRETRYTGRYTTLALLHAALYNTGLSYRCSATQAILNLAVFTGFARSFEKCNVKPTNIQLLQTSASA